MRRRETTTITTIEAAVEQSPLLRPWLATRSARIAGIATAVPERVLTNEDLEKMVDTSDEWIRSRTGIRQRRIAAAGECTSDLAIRAARKLLERTGTPPEEIDLIIVATCTPDHLFPATACLVQEAIGADCGAFDLEAGCTGFVYGLAVGSSAVMSGLGDTVMVIGADVLSKVTDWTDRKTCVLFGDGAGAALLRPGEPGEGILSFDLGSDGAGAELLKIPGGGARYPAGCQNGGEHPESIHMNGNEVFRFAVRVMGASAERALQRAGVTGDDVDCFVPHQANLRIITAAARRIGVSMDRVMVNVDRYGNTSGASIPIALEEAEQSGRIHRDDLIVCVGFGAGLTWGACVIRW